MVELCKERVGLLVDAANEDRRLETWHCRCAAVERLGVGRTRQQQGSRTPWAQAATLLLTRGSQSPPADDSQEGVD
jgi:hypothetical protein